ncbi:MAG: hypothetical protein OXG65_03825 [Chloroflexi bacterium]|nr:hypothetical protein [Chloroflexota bacterium]
MSALGYLALKQFEDLDQLQAQGGAIHFTHEQRMRGSVLEYFWRTAS